MTMKKKILVTAVILVAVLLIVGCGEKKRNYIDGVAYSASSKTGYLTVIGSDPEFEYPLIAKKCEGQIVEDISNDAFSGGIFTSIVIPDTIKHVSPRAFVDCPNLKEITIKGSPRLREGCFCRLDALETVIFGEGTVSIPMEAFEDCGALREIYVPATCTEITGVIPEEVTLILQSEGLIAWAIENGWNFRMEDGTAVASMSLAEAIEAGKIKWESYKSGTDIDFKNVSDQLLIVDWPDNFELEDGDVTRYIPEGATATLNPGDSWQLAADYYTTYGPEETTVQIAAESEYLYCMLYKENRKLDTELLVEPHTRETLTLPCGRYSVRILSGESAEEASAKATEDASWQLAYAWNFEAESFYEVCRNKETRNFNLEEYGEYGPGESYLYLKLDERSVCYRLFRVGGELELEIFLEPGQYRTVSFPSGRYKLRIAEGDTWISDEEAFGEEGKYSVIDYFDYEEGETYGITESAESGNIFKDSAGGFGG